MKAKNHLRKVFFAMLGVWLLPGCAESTTNIQLTASQQRAEFVLRASDAFVDVYDSSGTVLRMPDGKQIVMDNPTFEREVLPLLTPLPQPTLEPVTLDATFSLKRESIVVDVVQGSDGEATDVSREYWTIEITQIHSVR